MNYTGWEERSASVAFLYLDSSNPRIPELDHEATQREIIAELLRHENLLELTKTIAQQGFFPTEVLVCVEEEDRLVVVEGNRRLASLKLLLNPGTAPDEYTKRIKALASNASSPIATEIKVAIAPSRAAAAPLVMTRHTQLVVKGWEPIQQARYIRGLLNAGSSMDELAANTGFSKGDLLNGLRMHTMYEVARSIDIDPKLADIVRDPRRFNASTLKRVIESPRMRDLLGIHFDEIGGVVGKVHPDDFKRAYRQILEDIAAERINTRILNNAEAIAKYAQKLEAVAPRRKGEFTSESLLGKEDAREKDRSDTQAATRSPRKSPYLVPRSFKCHLPMPRIRDVVFELQRIPIERGINAIAVLLRIFIELSVSHYMEATGKMKPLIARLDKDRKKPKTWSPTLRQMLNDILSNDAELDIPVQARKALARAVSDDDHPLSLDSMDQFVHNPYVAPTERQLRQMWNSFESLLTFLMLNRSSPGKKEGK